MTLAAVPDPPTLAERLAEAQRAAEPTGRLVTGLERALNEALGRQDYAAAERTKDELAAARMEHGIAAAQVSGLQSALVEAERLRAEDARAIQEQQQVTEARAEIDRQRQAFRAAQENSARLLEAAAAKVAEVKQVVAEMLASDAEAAEATRVMSERRQLLGDGPLGAPFSPAKHLLETDRLIGDIWRRREPVDGKAWPR